MLQFFKGLWGGVFPAVGNLTLSLHSPGHKSVVCRHIPFGVFAGLGPDDLTELEEINAGKTSGFTVPQDIYFGLASRVDGLDPSEQGLKDRCLALPAFAIDIDVLDPAAHKAASLPATAADALSLLEGEPDPSFVVDSGHGLQVYWVFRQPLMLQGPGALDRVSVEASYARFWQRFQTRAANKGWHLDRVSTVERIWRVPGCVNHKVPTAPCPTRLLGASGKVYDVVDLDNGVVLPTAAVSLPPPPAGAFDFQPPAFTATVEDVIRRLKRKGEDSTAELRQRILNGEMLATQERDAAFNKACNILVWHAPDADPELLVGMLRPSLVEWASAPGATKTLDEELAKARDKISRARADWISKKAAVHVSLSSAWGSFKVGRSGQANPSEASAAGATATTVEAVPITAAEAKKLVMKCLVIQHQTAYYIWDATVGRYSAQHTREEVPLVMRDALKNTDVDFFYENAKGQMVKKKLPDLLDSYGTVSDGLSYSMSIQKSEFHIESSTFVEAVCPVRRHLTPRFDQDIDTWLRLLGKSNPEKLLDWVAVSTKLESPICAIYLSGPKGTGKGLFAAGIAKQWGSAATDLERIIGNFNADLVKCPLVLMDEAMPRGFGSAELRSMISRKTWTLARKFLPNCMMDGSMRLVIAANNDDVLQSISDEATTAEDIDATVDRILHIHVSPEAAAFLISLGGIRTTRDWVDGDKIARHALWLRDNRVVVPGNRFLVQGTPTLMHRRLVSNGTVQNLVLEWITRYLLNPDKLRKWCAPSGNVPLIHAGSGKIYINTTTLIDGWSAYMRPDIRVPTHTRVGKILRSFSTDNIRIPSDGPRFHVIDPSFVVGWAEENQLGRPEDLAAALTRPLS